MDSEPTPVPNVDDALAVVQQVCASVNASLAQHQQIQQALQIVTAAAKEPKSE